jgi:DNA adenine methylase
MAAWIVDHFPPHLHYLEPFFGSGACFFLKQPAAHEVVNDLDGDIVNLFRVLRTDGGRLAALVALTPWSREEYEACKDLDTDDLLERARRFLVLMWQSHGSTALTRGSSWRHAGVVNVRTLPSRQWAGLPLRLCAVIERLESVEIENRPALEVIQRSAHPSVLIYADPPYPLSTRANRMYRHEMSDTDHMQLLDALHAHPGPVVLSGYHCPLYDNRLQGWHVVERRVQAEKGKFRTEVLWLNERACVNQQMRLAL